MAHTRPLGLMVGTAAFLFLGVVACSSDDGPTPPDGSIVPAAIQAQIDALFPAGNLNDSATDQIEEVLERADAGETAQAQTAFVGFVAFGAEQAGSGTLLDPGDAAPPTIEDALADLGRRPVRRQLRAPQHRRGGPPARAHGRDGAARRGL